MNIGIQNEREWRQFCALVLLNTEIAADPRFDSNSKRSDNRKVLRTVISEIFRTLTRDEDSGAAGTRGHRPLANEFGGGAADAPATREKGDAGEMSIRQQALYRRLRRQCSWMG